MSKKRVVRRNRTLSVETLVNNALNDCEDEIISCNIGTLTDELGEILNNLVDNIEAIFQEEGFRNED